MGLVWYESDDRPKLIWTAAQRIGLAARIGLQVATDYKLVQSRSYSSEQECIEAKSQCHLRSAQRVLRGLQKLGGIYVKLGQHVSTMNYILPTEWTSTLAVLQDRCDPSTPEDLRAMFWHDCGQSLDDVFDEFNWQPIGVASLAQVHKARLGSQWVAVKFQHARLDEFYRIDLQTVSFIIHTIKRIFPDFGFEWIMEEMEQSLPQELDFEHEAANALQVKKNFEHCSTALVIPNIIWAKRRILCMEFIDGARVDDLEYLEKHHIDSSAVSTEITNIFSKMMFIDGFVHCDPHPGNIFIRPAKRTRTHPYNFDVVLLDHGLYRTLTDQLRTDYAHLWTSLIRGEEEGIRKYSLRVGCRPESHRLFASLLTGREWSTIQSASLSSDRTITEISRVSGRAKYFLNRIYDILETLPRIVVLLLKTSDLLRSLDENLRKSKDKYMTYALMGRYCAEAVWIDQKTNLLHRLQSALTLSAAWELFKNLVVAWWKYELLEFALWAYRVQSSTREKWLLFWKQEPEQVKSS
ncbi:ubiquinone biosynthesis protein [Rhizopus microsporus]|uniref:Ubiquinone biosynthesis protein n=1 Tax=Rhizopus microsporus TaxID=58291 RepID=A0A1X0RZ94_RHIZD|nr:ubiquinone biosynthesis protein [Rhizopus microsporus]